MKTVNIWLAASILLLTAGTVAASIEIHEISMFKEADDCGNIISKDDNVILLYPFPVESDIPSWEEEFGVCGWPIEGTAYNAITLEYPVIGISIPSPGEIVSKPEVRATLRSTSAYTDPIPEGLSKIKATSIRVKFIDEEKNEFEGRSLLYPDEDSSCIRIISSAPYDLPNGVYTVEVYCENTNGQSAKEVCKFILMRPYSSTNIWPLWEIEYDAYSFQRECSSYDELIGETWGKYSGDQGSDPLDMNYYELIGQSGYVRWSGYDEEKDVYLNCEVEIRGSYAFGDYSLKSKKYYRKAKLEINIDRRPCTSPGQVLCKYHRLGNNQCSDAEFNPFYLEVYIDGVKAGEKLMEKTDVCCETCVIDIPLDIDTVKAGENINVELKTNRLQKVNPITGDKGEYIEEIEVLSTGTHFGTHSGVHLILYEPEAEGIEEPPEEEEEPISGSFETMQYIFSEPKILSKLCISSSLASVGDWFPVNSPSKITITPYIVEDVTTEYLTWRELETYIFTEPTESPCCAALPENTNASGVKYTVTIVSDSSTDPPQLSEIILEFVETKDLGVIHQVQHKDTQMLCLGGCNHSLWDNDHGGRICEHDNKYCAMASISMIAKYYEGDLSQDRIVYHKTRGAFSTPEHHLMLHAMNMGVGLGTIKEIKDELSWALNDAKIDTESEKPTFDQVKAWIDENRPIIWVMKAPDGLNNHATVIDGYTRGQQFLHVIDPWSGKEERLFGNSREIDLRD